MSDAVRDIVELTRSRSAESGDRVAYVFLEDGERQEQTITYGELDRRARAIAVTIHAAHEQHVLLLYPPGIDYICAFLGCLYAGAVAIPAYPPDPARLNRTLPRLQAIAHDSKAGLVLTTQPILAM